MDKMQSHPRNGAIEIDLAAAAFNHLAADEFGRNRRH
jgi:hypothetical protein